MLKPADAEKLRAVDVGKALARKFGTKANVFESAPLPVKTKAPSAVMSLDEYVAKEAKSSDTGPSDEWGGLDKPVRVEETALPVASRKMLASVIRRFTNNK